jgi:hypothetical protein
MNFKDQAAVQQHVQEMIGRSVDPDIVKWVCSFVLYAYSQGDSDGFRQCSENVDKAFKALRNKEAA